MPTPRCRPRLSVTKADLPRHRHHDGRPRRTRQRGRQDGRPRDGAWDGPAPSIPLLNTKRDHRDFGLLKKVGLPTLYWNFMLKGLA